MLEGSICQKNIGLGMNTLGDTAFIGADDDYDKLLAERERNAKKNMNKALHNSTDIIKPYEDVSLTFILLWHYTMFREFLLR